MLDTSALVAALVANHEFHELTRPHLPNPTTSRLPGIVLAETYACLRGEPFRVDATTASQLLAPWRDDGEILVTPASAYERALREAPSLNLGGQIHDYLIVLTCAHHGCPLVTADRRQIELGRPIMADAGLEVTFVTPEL